MNTTIAAISTARAAAGISVIRISGDEAIAIADRVFKAKLKKNLSAMQGYTCAFGAAYADDGMIDECIASVFRAPHSYTGEDVVELSCHGGVYITARILRALYDAGAVAAEPGEFTKRAFLNGKLDLIEAESVMDIISARSRGAARAALNVKEGVLSRRIGLLKTLLTDLAAHLAAWADYPEEDIPAVDHASLSESLTAAEAELNDVIRSYDNGRILKEGVDTAIIGKPNVGKSTLMNLLAGCDRSIVTSVAGTTRDVVEEAVHLGDLVLNLSDTAGIRSTDDEVERIGVDKAKSRLNSAALILCVFDASSPLSQEDREIIAEVKDAPAIAILNKCDLTPAVDTQALGGAFRDVIAMSAKNATGLDELNAAIRRVCNADTLDTTAALVYNERQRSLVIQARDAVREALGALNTGITYDAVTVLIEEAIASLCELTGERVTDEVVDRVFHTFCVGK